MTRGTLRAQQLACIGKEPPAIVDRTGSSFTNAAPGLHDPFHDTGCAAIQPHPLIPYVRGCRKHLILGGRPLDMRAEHDIGIERSATLPAGSIEIIDRLTQDREPPPKAPHTPVLRPHEGAAAPAVERKREVAIEVSRRQRRPSFADLIIEHKRSVLLDDANRTIT